jgi:undecaprenyl-diphosphatase
LGVSQPRNGLALIAEALAAGGALTMFVVGARSAGTGRVGAMERRAFTAVNALTSSASVPVWTVMQVGSLGGALGVAGIAAATGHRELGVRLAVAGTTTWAAAKVVKQFVRRGRPSDTLDGVRVLGRDASGLGYPSGHAAVASTLAVLVIPALPPVVRPWIPVVALTVGVARIYVGAHLPLDVAGGLAFGAAIGLAADMLMALTSS